jgi:hypothetical protein
MLQFMFYLSLLMFVLFIDKRKARYGILALVFAVIASLVHPLAYSLFLVFIAYGIWSYYQMPRKKRKALIRRVMKKKWLVIGALVAALALFIWRFDYFLRVLFTDSNYLRAYVTYLMMFYFFILSFALGGFFIAKRRLLLFFIMFVPIYFISFHQQLLHFRYLFVILPVMFILASYSMLYLLRGASKWLSMVLFVFIVAALFSTGQFTLAPTEHYELEFQTPQPDFKAAYTWLLHNAPENATIVASYGPMAELYYGRPDYVLDFSLSGIPNTSMRYLNKSYDKYIGVDVLNNRSFIGLTEDKGGYIVIDALAKRRINATMASSLSRMELVYAGSKDRWSEVWVYRW